MTIWGGAIASCLVSLQAQIAFVPESEALYAPTAQRIAAVQAAAKRDGWAPHAAVLRAAAATAYEKDKLQAAEAWLNLYRWAKLLGQSENEFIPAWIAAVQNARVAHPNMSTRYTPRPQALGAALAPEVQAWAMGNASFSAEFFALLSPVDYVPRVFEILSELHKRDAARFKSFASLALAIAVVYDVPPPPVWPHGQVSPQVLPRVLPEPGTAFGWWIKQEQNGRLYHRVSRLGADELKFVVDVTAPFTELEWAQQVADQPLNQLAATYSMIRYRNDRLANNQPVWPGRSYRLPDILALGGICADQAYFATHAGKARGVPTLLFYGPGNDGRHAWFGYLDGNSKWKLDAGRYAEQKFVTGFARDPQTWREFTDHELQFLSERFRELPAFKQSRVHASFAEEFLAQGKAAAAAVAARKAVNFDKRNQPAWETLLAAAKKEGKDAKVVEGLLREAALAFQRYPDLHAGYVNRVAESLRGRGDTSAADAEVANLVRRNKSARGDIAVGQARETVARAVATQALPEQVKAFNAVVDSHGRGAGMGFFDGIVVPFVEHLMALDQRAEAAKALDRAQRVLNAPPNSQLATELERLSQAVQRAK